jgi:glycosyltransferase involved in cell wall biosynthesis
MESLNLALDVGPLYGQRTGVAVATDHLLHGLQARPEVTVTPYLLSARATPLPGHVRLPLPAAAAHRIWSRLHHPRVDRWLPGAQMLHGTNYVAPPSRIPAVISVYDCWFLMHPESASPAVNRSAAVLRRAVARGAHLHVSSQATAQVAAELLHTDRIHVVHLGPPTLPEQQSDQTEIGLAGPDLLGPLGLNPERSRLIIAIGTIEKRKDLGALVAAFGLIAADLPDTRLVIAGAPGDDYPQVLAAVQALAAPISLRVHLLGSIDQPTKQALLGAAKLLAYPSRDEGFGFPILEAQLAGVPVVARPCGSIPEVGGSGIALTADLSVQSLADSIANVLSHEDVQMNLIHSGSQNLHRFSWDRCVDQMLEVYQSVGEQ